MFRRLSDPVGDLITFDFEGTAFEGGVTLAANHALEASRRIIEGGVPEETACFSADRFDVSQAA